KTAIIAGWRQAGIALVAAALASILAMAAPVYAKDQGQLFAAEQDGYGRLILSFPALDELPAHEFRIENGVLAIEFENPVDIILPDVGLTMPNYLAVARLDPDGRGLRIGLRSSFNFNRI